MEKDINNNEEAQKPIKTSKIKLVTNYSELNQLLNFRDPHRGTKLEKSFGITYTKGMTEIEILTAIKEQIDTLTPILNRCNAVYATYEAKNKEEIKEAEEFLDKYKNNTAIQDFIKSKLK